MDRIIAQPGTVPAYKVGELKIRELRAYAQKELGPEFDLRAFHDRVLGHGQLPLDLLEKSIKDWVREQIRASSAALRRISPWTSADCAILSCVETMDDRVDPEVRRVAELLSMVVRMSGRSRRSIEEELGLGSSGLSKILNGTVRLQMSHILSILQAVEVDPGEFFQVAYPRRWARRKDGLMKQVGLLMKEEPVPEEMDDPEEGLEDFDERVRLVMLRLLGGGPQR